MFGFIWSARRYDYWYLVWLISFEKELKNKLAQKSSGITSEEQVLKKSFKYFDLNGNGTVEPDEFAKAIEKIGIMIPTKQVSSLNFKLISTVQNIDLQYLVNDIWMDVFVAI